MPELLVHVISQYRESGLNAGVTMTLYRHHIIVHCTCSIVLLLHNETRWYLITVMVLDLPLSQERNVGSKGVLNE